MIGCEPHGGGAGPQLLLGDVEAALAALKGSAVFDGEPHMQTVEVMELITAKIVELRAGLAEGRTVITAPPSLF